MDNFDGVNPDDRDLEEPIPFDDDDISKAGVSHSPLNLGGGKATEAPKVEPAAKAMMPTTKKATEKIASTDRIIGVKTFFTKLHAGAIEFLDGQISNWLKENPEIRIHRTNITTGEMTGKKVEPNIIITIWY